MILENGVRVVVPQSTYNDGREVHYNTAGFTITSEYTNYTDSVIYAKTQTNIPFVIDVNTAVMHAEEPRAHLEIKLTYKLVNNAGIAGTSELLSALVNNDHLLSDDAAKLNERLTDLFTRDGARTNKINFTFVVYRRIIDDDFKKNQSVYLRETDIILSKNRTAMALPHPNSSIGLQQTEVAMNRTYAGQAGIVMKIVDNLCLAEERYYYAGKQLITVPSTLDPAREDGVYYTVSTRASDGGVTPVSAFLSFKDAETTLGLYRFKEDALSHGNPEILLKVEESRNKAQERVASGELLRLKQESDRLALQHERELTELRQNLERQRTEHAALKDSIDFRKSVRDDSFDEHKKKRESKKQRKDEEQAFRQALLDAEKKARDDRYDREDKRRKDYYEDRSYVRKDTSELIKFIPAVILGIVGTMAIMRQKSA